MPLIKRLRARRMRPRPVSPSAVLCRYPCDAWAAATFSWDDACVEDLRIAALLRRYGVKATFHVAPGLLGPTRRVSTWGEVWGDRYRPVRFPLAFLALNELPEAYRGHEIAAHTVTHPDLTRLRPEEVYDEALRSRRLLESITGAPVEGFAYPHGRYNAAVVEAVRRAGFTYARTTHSSRRAGLPANLLVAHPTGHWKQVGMQRLRAVYRARGIVHLYGHGYELRRGADWRRLERIVRWLRARRTWCATLTEIIAYRRAVQAATVRPSGGRARWLVVNPSGIELTLRVRGRGRLTVDGRAVDFLAGSGWCQIGPGEHMVELQGG